MANLSPTLLCLPVSFESVRTSSSEPTGRRAPVAGFAKATSPAAVATCVLEHALSADATVNTTIVFRNICSISKLDDPVKKGKSCAVGGGLERAHCGARFPLRPCYVARRRGGTCPSD